MDLARKYIYTVILFFNFLFIVLFFSRTILTIEQKESARERKNIQQDAHSIISLLFLCCDALGNSTSSAFFKSRASPRTQNPVKVPLTHLIHIISFLTLSALLRILLLWWSPQCIRHACPLGVADLLTVKLAVYRSMLPLYLSEMKTLKFALRWVLKKNGREEGRWWLLVRSKRRKEYGSTRAVRINSRVTQDTISYITKK